MSKLINITLFIAIVSHSVYGKDEAVTQALRTFPGYVSKVSCDGKLLVSSIGNDLLIRLEPLPATLGCAVLLKPLAASGRTNLILETSSNSIQIPIEIRAGVPTSQELRLKVQGDHI